MQKVELEVIVAMVASTPEGDTLNIGINAPAVPFPSDPRIPPILTIRLESRTGAEWCRKVLGIDPKQIIVDGKVTK
jgi:hypothetical protein